MTLTEVCIEQAVDCILRSKYGHYKRSRVFDAGSDVGVYGVVLKPEQKSDNEESNNES